MTMAPYIIELRGGRFDGYRKPVEALPLHDRLLLPARGPRRPKAIEPRVAAIYQRRQTALVFQDGVPTLLLRYEYQGHTVLPPERSLLARARRLRRRIARAFRRVARP
jgi:hypothetical protein